MRNLILACFCLLSTGSVCIAQGGAGGGPCVRYIVPYDYERVCTSFYLVSCLTGQTSQCGNPETHAICVNKSFKYHGDDYNETVKKQRNANPGEEGRERNDDNPDQYECAEEGDCQCRWSSTYWKCEGNRAFDITHIDIVDWSELSTIQCFGT